MFKSNYLNKSTNLLCRYKDSYSFLGAITSKIVESAFIQNFTDKIRRRIFFMFRQILERSNIKPTVVSLDYKYKEIVEELTIPFINDYGNFAISSNFRNDISKCRTVLVNFLTQLTGAGNVNVAFVKDNIDGNEGITFYINETKTSSYNKRDIKELDFTINGLGLQLSNTTSLTMVIPLTFIESIINIASKNVKADYIKRNIKLGQTDPRLTSGIRSYVKNHFDKNIYVALIASIYKELLFNRFASDVYSVAADVNTFHKSKDIHDLVKSINYKPTTLSKLEFGSFCNIIKEYGLREINPHSILDVFELPTSEIESYLIELVEGYNTIYPVEHNPKYYALFNDENYYVDKESRMACNLVHSTKLNTAIIFLLLATSDSIKEVEKVNYLNGIKQGLYSYNNNIVNNVTGNKELLLGEIDNQVKVIKSLCSEIIKLKSFVKLMGA